MGSKLDEIRDELADAIAVFCHCAGPTCSGCEYKTKDLFSIGWDAAMERVKPLVEAVTENINHHEYCQFRYGEKCECTAALINEAIKEFYGETE